MTPSTWIEQLSLTNFRNYKRAQLVADASPVVLVGHNGAGKTNILEAVSLIAPGRGLRRAAFADLVRATPSTAALPDVGEQSGSLPSPSLDVGGWALSAHLHVGEDVLTIGTGSQPSATGFSGSSPKTGRIVRIDGEPQKSATVLGEYVEISWLTPALDGLFTGGTSDRRRFLDRLVLCFDPAHGQRATQFERAMRQRNRLLDVGARSAREYEGLEEILAATGVAISAARVEVVQRLRATIERRRDQAGPSAFPWAKIGLTGSLEEALAGAADAEAGASAGVSGTAPSEVGASDVEDQYRERLGRERGRDQAARRTLEGPHRADLDVVHGPKAMPAKLCSTGEQKALLVGLVLAHADMLARRAIGGAPILLLDEISAHLDSARRAALFDEIVRLGSQAWMTGTDRVQFAALDGRATIYEVSDGQLERFREPSAI